MIHPPIGQIQSQPYRCRQFEMCRLKNPSREPTTHEATRGAGLTPRVRLHWELDSEELKGRRDMQLSGGDFFLGGQLVNM